MKPTFKYTRNMSQIHCIPCGMGDEVHVVGDPENAAYEWIIYRNGASVEHSDDGFGSPEAALRDGLNTYLG